MKEVHMGTLSRSWRPSLPALLVVSAACLSLAHAQSLPEGNGKAQVERVCAGCHPLTVVTKARKTEAEWGGVVSDMVARGAQGTQDDLNWITKYLAMHFGPGRPASGASATPANAPTPAPAAIPNVPPPPGDAAKGKTLFEANGCLGCHRAGGKGAYVGPDLSDLANQITPQEMERSIVAPDEEVLPENRYARVATRNGETVTGRILNRDGFSVQIIDTKDQLRSFPIAKTREVTILDKGLMPSYKDKLAAQDVADIVNYLCTLKGADKP